MNSDEQWKVVAAVIRWLEVRGKHSQELSAPWLAHLYVDALHSALLRRLLSGLEPMPEPPPLRYNYPDYSQGQDQASTSGEQ